MSAEVVLFGLGVGEEDGIGDAEFLDVFGDGFLADFGVVGDADDVEAVGGVLLAEGFEPGHFDLAGGAVGSPEVDDEGWPLKSLRETCLPLRSTRESGGAGLPSSGEGAVGIGVGRRLTECVGDEGDARGLLRLQRRGGARGGYGSRTSTTSEIPATIMNSKSALRISSRASFRASAFRLPASFQFTASRALAFLEHAGAFGQDFGLGLAGTELGEAGEAEVHEGGLLGGVFVGGESDLEVALEVLRHAVWMRELAVAYDLAEVGGFGGRDGEVVGKAVGRAEVAHRQGGLLAEILGGDDAMLDGEAGAGGGAAQADVVRRGWGASCGRRASGSDEDGRKGLDEVDLDGAVVRRCSRVWRWPIGTISA